jgi:uncharacterized protein involved in exopolysaccharide biosynthesis
MADEGLGSLVLQVKKYIEFARRLLRRWWLVAIFTVVGIGGSVGVALMMTRIYESRTLIQWKESLNQSRVFSSEETQQQQENWLQPRIEQLVSSRTRLWKLAQDIDLYSAERKALAPEVLLDLLRKSIKFDTVGSDSFWISFEYKDPQKAQQGAARLAHEFIEQNVGDRLRAALATQTFMETETNKVRQALVKIEGELAQFVSDHPEFQIDPATGMPRALTGGRTGTAPPGAAQYAGVRNPELRRALTQKGQLEARLQLLMSPQSDARLQQARQDTQNAQRMLSAKRQQYTDQHPDVQRLQRYVAQQIANLRNLESSSRTSSTAQGQAIRDQIAALDETIRRLSAQRATPRPDAPKATPKAEGTLTGTAATAAAEKQWYQLTRDREITKAKYDQLYERLTKVKVNASLEKQRAETQYTIVDPANFPQKPIRPSRSKLVIAGTFLGLLLGFALAALLVILDPRIYNEDDLRKACDLPILAQIPKEA